MGCGIGSCKRVLQKAVVVEFFDKETAKHISGVTRVKISDSKITKTLYFKEVGNYKQEHKYRNNKENLKQ